MAKSSRVYRVKILNISCDWNKSHKRIILCIFCFSFFMTYYVAQGKSVVNDAPTSRSYIIVFDLDETLCEPNIDKEQVKLVAKHYPECPVITWTYRRKKQPHVFVPYLQVLFDYLLGKGGRIVFFSTAIEERDEAVITELLTSFWGSKKFEVLKAEEKVALFCRWDLRMSNSSLGESGQFKKDLMKVIRDGESVSDAILIDDDPTFVAHNQEPLMNIIELIDWDLDIGSEGNYPLNNVYYMLGVFKTYFEDKKYKDLPLREGIKQIIPIDKSQDSNFFTKHPFAKKMIDIGLKEVQKHYPKAKFYSIYTE